MSDILPPLNREQALEVDIDLRLVEIYQELPLGPEEISLDVIAAFMRACYGKGYVDALAEKTPGTLCRTHGYQVPTRATA